MAGTSPRGRRTTQPADRDLARDVLESTRRARGVEGIAPPQLAKAAGMQKSKAQIPRVSKNAAKALAAAGHRLETLTGLQLHDLGAEAAALTLRDVGEIHAEFIRSTYRGMKVPQKNLDRLIEQKVPSWELLDLGSPCDGSISSDVPWLVDPGKGSGWDEGVDFEQISKLVETLRNPFRDLPFPHGPKGPRKPDGDDWRKDFGVEQPSSHVDTLEPLTVLEAARLGRETDVEVARAGELLALAQAADFAGDSTSVQQLLGEAAGIQPGPLSAREQFQVRALLPAVAAAITGPSPASMRAARSAMKVAPPATAAGTIAARAAVRAAAMDTRRAVSQAAHGGPGARTRKAAAIEAASDLLTARYLDGLSARPAAALETATAMLDLYTAVGASIGTPRTSPVRVERGKPVYGKEGGRGPIDVLRHGAAAHLADQTRLAHVYGAFHQIYELCPPQPMVLDLLQSWTPWRFDWLLSEARHLVDDLGRIDALAVDLVDMLWRAALDKLEAQDALRKQLDALVQQLVKQVDETAAKLRDTVAGAIPRLRELGAMQAIYNLLSAWPHDNWIAVATAVGAAFAAGTDPLAAARGAIAANLGAGIAAALASAKAQITSTLQTVEDDLHKLLLPSDPNAPINRVRQEITGLIGSDPLADLLAALGQDAVHTVTVTPALTAPTFTLSVTVPIGPGATVTTPPTAPIAATAPAAVVQAALAALGRVGAGNVSVTGGPGRTAPYTVKFTARLGCLDVKLTAAPAGVTIVTTTTGSTGLCLVPIAAPILDEIDAATSAGVVPAWLDALLLGYVAGPFLAALGVIAGGLAILLTGLPLPFIGWIAAAICAFIVAAGVQYLVAVVLKLLGSLLSFAGDIQAEVNTLITQLRAIGGDLVRALSIVGQLNSAVNALNALLADLAKAFPAEVNSALEDAVLAARTALRANLATVAGALELSFFRETLEIVEVLPDLELPHAPKPDPTKPDQPTTYDPNLGFGSYAASLLSRFEAERIRRIHEPNQVLTHVLSLRQLLPGTAAQNVATLQQLLTQRAVVAFDLRLEDVDRAAPGFHRQLIRDVQVQVDFALDDVPLPPLGQPNVPLPGMPAGSLTGPAGQTITRADAIAAILDEASKLAGGQSDPSLEAAVPGAGFRGLPVSAGRIPTGVPAVIGHRGKSTFRIRDATSIEDAAARGSPLVVGVSLDPDPDPMVAALGWKRLTIDEPARAHVLSHFRVLEDGIRFFDPEKEINPLEFRSPAGSWTFEIPAVRWGAIQPQLPPIKDVRLIVSTNARYDSNLAEAAATALPALYPWEVPEPDPRDSDALKDLLVDPLSSVVAAIQNVAKLVGDLLNVTSQLPTLLSGIQGQLTNLVGEVTSLGTLLQGTNQKLEDLRRDVDAALASVVTQLSAKIGQLETAVNAGFTALGGDLGALGPKLDEIAELSATADALLLQLATAAAPIGGVRQLRVIPLSTDDLGASEAAVLAGTATGTFTITPATLSARGITTPATVAWVVVTAVTTAGGLIGGGVTFPAAPGTLTFTPARGAVRTVSLPFTSPTITTDGTTLGGGTAPTSPVGTWALKLPTGMPALSSAIVAIFVEGS